MDYKALRAMHPEFVYEKFDYGIENGILTIKFHFHVAPALDFYPILEIPVPSSQIDNLDTYIFNLGLVELISYWKATCSPKVIIKPGALSGDQVNWWKSLFINGLGEFFYQNQIDFNDSGFLDFEVTSHEPLPIDNQADFSGELILMGGGKDSAVTAELIGSKNANALLLNPTSASLKTTTVAGFVKPIVVKRTIDARLLQLNEQGYLNGHTPFSAYLSFLSAVVARLYKHKNLIVSNEQSAGEANLKYLGLSVNHQYSKSYEYEGLFRDYTRAYLNPNLNYFSFVRPLNELQVAALFLQNEKYDTAFNSCNTTKNEYWCGECAKCAFVYLIFSALSDKSRVKKIFGERDFFENEKIKKYIEELIGNGLHKPLDCVGTEEESRMALSLIKDPDNYEIIDRIKNDWSEKHFLPEEYKQLLRNVISSIKL